MVEHAHIINAAAPRGRAVPRALADDELRAIRQRAAARDEAEVRLVELAVEVKFRRLAVRPRQRDVLPTAGRQRTGGAGAVHAARRGDKTGLDDVGGIAARRGGVRGQAERGIRVPIIAGQKSLAHIRHRRPDPQRDGEGGQTVQRVGTGGLADAIIRAMKIQCAGDDAVGGPVRLADERAVATVRGRVEDVRAAAVIERPMQNIRHAQNMRADKNHDVRVALQLAVVRREPQQINAGVGEGHRGVVRGRVAENIAVRAAHLRPRQHVVRAVVNDCRIQNQPGVRAVGKGDVSFRAGDDDLWRLICPRVGDGQHGVARRKYGIRRAWQQERQHRFIAFHHDFVCRRDEQIHRGHAARKINIRRERRIIHAERRLATDAEQRGEIVFRVAAARDAEDAVRAAAFEDVCHHGGN